MLLSYLCIELVKWIWGSHFQVDPLVLGATGGASFSPITSHTYMRLWQESLILCVRHSLVSLTSLVLWGRSSSIFLICWNEETRCNGQVPPILLPHPSFTWGLLMHSWSNHREETTVSPKQLFFLPTSSNSSGGKMIFQFWASYYVIVSSCWAGLKGVRGMAV